MSWWIDVRGSYLADLRDLLTMRHRYRPGSSFRTRLRNETRRLITKIRGTR